MDSPLIPGADAPNASLGTDLKTALASEEAATVEADASDAPDTLEAADAPEPIQPSEPDQPVKAPGRGRRPPGSTPVPPLTLDLAAVADVEGLAEEVAIVRASIRELAHPHGDLSEHVKILAELRHQVEALCSTLKAQQALEGDAARRGGVSAAELARTLDELGDRLGVPR